MIIYTNDVTHCLILNSLISKKKKKMHPLLNFKCLTFSKSFF